MLDKDSTFDPDYRRKLQRGTHPLTNTPERTLPNDLLMAVTLSSGLETVRKAVLDGSLRAFLACASRLSVWDGE